MRQSLVCIVIMLATMIYVDACQVPVFRYALERWVTDRYQVAVLHRGELSEDAQAALTQLQSAGADEAINLEVTGVYNFAEMSEDEAWLVDAGDHALPQIQVRYPLGAKLSTMLWQAPLNQASVKQLIDSPVREAVQSRIVEGASAVWVLVEQGSEAEDAKAAEALEEHLGALQAQLSLPEGVIGNEAFAAGQVDATVPGFEMDNVLRSAIPLQIQFPIVRLQADDASESFFRTMLLSAASYLHEPLSEPVAVPVFGRGRMMHGLPASRLTNESLESACRYLCGACSCQVKEQNPGIDLLMRASWDDLLQGQLMIMERSLPPLAGVGDLESIAAPAIAMARPSTGIGALKASVMIALGFVLVMIASATVFLVLRSRNP